MPILLRFLLSALFFVSHCYFGQNRAEKYYEDEMLLKETTRKKAKFSKTVTEKDSITTTEVRELKGDKLVHRDLYKGEEPVGKWIDYDGSELDYDFALIYQPARCEVKLPGVINYAAKNDSVGYKPPVMGPTFFRDISLKTRYPSRQREEGVGGKVYLQFTVAENGSLVDVTVLKGVHPAIDKEAVRVLRQSRFQAPAYYKNEPKPACMTLPISFKVQ